MNLSQELINKGFKIQDVVEADFNDYYAVNKACYEKYVDEYFGGWDDYNQQNKIQTEEFNKALKQSTFKKIIMFDEVVGFFAFDELEDKIDGVQIQMIDNAQNMGIGSFYLKHIISLSDKNNKPVFLRVFKSNSARDIYKRFGFCVYDENISHYYMKYEPNIVV